MGSLPVLLRDAVANDRYWQELIYIVVAKLIIANN